MPALHCNRCDVDWPVDYTEFRWCPECQDLTWWLCAGIPLDSAVALSRKRHADFDRFYQQREDMLRAQVDAIDVPA